MAAKRDQAPTAESRDPLAFKYGGEAARDDRRRAVLREAIERLLDEALALRAERARRLTRRKPERGLSRPRA